MDWLCTRKAWQSKKGKSDQQEVALNWQERSRCRPAKTSKDQQRTDKDSQGIAICLQGLVVQQQGLAKDDLVCVADICEGFSMDPRKTHTLLCRLWQPGIKTHAYSKDILTQIKKPTRIAQISPKETITKLKTNGNSNDISTLIKKLTHIIQIYQEYIITKLKTHAYSKDISALIKKPTHIAAASKKCP